VKFDSDTWLLVLNPVSGRGAGLRDRRRIEAALDAHGLGHHAMVSGYPGHTTVLVAQAIAAGCRRIVVAGGDGSLSEAANGILGQSAVPAERVALGLVPVGTGNDWARMRGVPHDYAAAAAVIAAGASAPQDVGVIDFADGSRRHFVNVAGTGFDAGVVERMPDRRLGRLAYLIGLLREMAGYRPLPLRWRDPGGEAGAQTFVMFACIGRYCGGGMFVAPAARDDDGLLDIALIRHMGRIEVIRSLPRLFDGSIARHPKVSTWQTAGIELLGPAGASVEADGELVGRLPASIAVRSRALQVMVPAPV
jgi:YegS/Rv2252/BmrU family lipid kinase